MITGGRVEVASRVVMERIDPRGSVGAAGYIVLQRTKSAGRVEGAGRVTEERFGPSGRVAEAGCKAEERIIALSSISPGITSVRRRTHPESIRGRRKRQADEHERDEKQTAPQRRPAD